LSVLLHAMSTNLLGELTGAYFFFQKLLKPSGIIKTRNKYRPVRIPNTVIAAKII